LKLNRIEPFIVKKDIGLYNFVYSKGNNGNGDLIVRVLKFSDQHYLFENFEQADSIYNLFEIKYKTLFTKEEIENIKRLYTAGVIIKLVQ
jgi:hypothetical protein